ncbi:MAG: methylated-DNA--[protein]-cysteine S-methyltransferase [Gammaproteobacteria bacterium]|jgi:AraC family transcriptional regulator of adaptative response/methylated-DNA-[protein]-cysteine methyltransferase|nr:LysR family transcriptional regulator [Chromatiales bacterium]MCP4926630.1 methylated-DNA--[protein]-cysteine S-methyltransferase [Gammaproteobacteria bacterium]MDP7154159.1 methylated-DNA--[protein]-cysteine S-methyltransferase [Gammaproteobacteria bacterium]MDP7418265.1 methylated-DNA--[protein]-cysteine S-methyltransferase [Gammaproteobacteria bacterium]MDP7661293.1 methylated-DNA--[protein]-cysteine S-methyltransferase [Gammaproteobacteria bacterium]
MDANTSEIISYDFFVSQFGRGLIAGSAAGICDIAFAGVPHAELVCELELQNPGRKTVYEPGRFADICRHMFLPDALTCVLDMQGSPFQIKVWSELRQIPIGQTISYLQLAHRLGYPRAARAAANAVAKNRIACLVPCHRVIRADGTVGGYRWGIARKSAMLAWECGVAAN